jgi:hypothetical protein
MKKAELRKSERQITVPKRIKVKLDARTTIMINRPSSLKVWKRIYPLAKVIHH